MRRYLVIRCLSVIPTLFGVALVVFTLVRMIPGDPAEVLLGGFATPERAAVLRQAMGLTRPLPVQFGIWLGDVVRGDFGRSIMSRQPVAREIWDRFPATLELTVTSQCFAVAAGVSLGILSATAHNTRLDFGATLVSVAGMSMPIFWLGLMLLYVFGVWLSVLPISGRLAVDVSLMRITGLDLVDSVLAGNWVALGDAVRHLVLPAFSLAVIPLATLSRFTRAGMLDVLQQEYVTVAHAKGVARRVVLWHHALRNALIPIVTVAGTRFGTQLAGAVLVEVVYAWPGIGRLVFDAIEKRDYPVIQGAVLFIAVLFVFINLVTDVVYAALDPRIRFE
ncbi:MAG TPA: ABC transporter permease [bacterium]|nr:ABC transporter permease [bacterium]